MGAHTKVLIQLYMPINTHLVTQSLESNVTYLQSSEVNFSVGVSKTKKQLNFSFISTYLKVLYSYSAQMCWKERKSFQKFFALISFSTHC
jgi:hypothetical protein